jgi:hypothetical protein
MARRQYRKVTTSAVLRPDPGPGGGGGRGPGRIGPIPGDGEDDDEQESGDDPTGGPGQIGGSPPPTDDGTDDGGGFPGRGFNPGDTEDSPAQDDDDDTSDDDTDDGGGFPGRGFNPGDTEDSPAQDDDDDTSDDDTTTFPPTFGPGGELDDGSPGGGGGGGGGTTDPDPEPAFRAGNVSAVSCSLADERVQPGGSSRVTVEVDNNNAQPAAVTVRVRADGDDVGRSGGQIPPQSTGSVAVDITMPRASGTYTIQSRVITATESVEGL